MTRVGDQVSVVLVTLDQRVCVDHGLTPFTCGMFSHACVHLSSCRWWWTAMNTSPRRPAPTKNTPRPWPPQWPCRPWEKCLVTASPRALCLPQPPQPDCKTHTHTHRPWNIHSTPSHILTHKQHAQTLYTQSSTWAKGRTLPLPAQPSFPLKRHWGLCSPQAVRDTHTHIHTQGSAQIWWPRLT